MDELALRTRKSSTWIHLYAEASGILTAVSIPLWVTGRLPEPDPPSDECFNMKDFGVAQ